MFGFLNVYKPKGITSHDVISRLRKVTGIKQIGHTGTLDPFAEGVLPVCVGKATRLIEFLNDDKAYIGTVKLGESTSTYDIEGEIVNTSLKKVNKEDIEAILTTFKGEIEQMPPKYSAIKIKGRKLYDYARKGEDVEIKPRKVCIYDIKLLSYDETKNSAEIYVFCSKGTYIRSIANDLGEILGTFGHLTKLIRVKAGDFVINESCILEDFVDKKFVESKMINPLNYIHYPVYELSLEEYQFIKNGNPIKNNSKELGITVLIYENQISAIGEADKNYIKCRKVFD